MDGTDSPSPNSQVKLEASLPAPESTSNTQAKPGLTRKILTLAVPALGALVAEPLFTLIDSAMIGHLGTASLAGLSLASQILQTLTILFIFLAYSTTSLTARALGAKDRRGAIRAGIDASWLAALLGLIVAVLLAALAPALVKLMTTDSSVAHEAVAYLRASAPGLIGMLIGYSTVGTLRGLQDTRTPLLITGIGAILNIGLNAVLMFGLGLGVIGSGLGTSIVQLLMAAVYLSILRREAVSVGAPLRPSGSGIARSALDGAPLIVRGLALRLAGLATIWSASQLGSEALAGYQIVLAIWTLICFVLDALAIAAQSMVGLALGRGKLNELRELLRILTIWGAGAGVVLGIVITVLSPWIPFLFDASSSVSPIARWGLIACCVGMPLGGVVFTLDGVLLGAGDNRYFAIAGIGQLLVFLPVLGLIELWRLEGAGSIEVVAAAWGAYALVYMGARLATNMWRTWWSRSGLLGSMDSSRKEG